MQAMRTRNFLWTGCNSLGLLLLCVAADSGSLASAAQGFQEKLLQVDVNQQQLNETVLMLAGESGELYMASRDLQRWRLLEPASGDAVDYQQEKYYPLRSLLCDSQHYDQAAQTLSITLRPEAFIPTTRTSQAEPLPLPVKPGRGGFLNYEVFAADSPESRQRSGQFELGYFNAWGVGIASVFIDQLASHPKPTRLDTTWSRDFPERLQTLRLGDAISTPGAWGRTVRFGGIQFGSNFATQPGFATFTPQSINGLAVLPSTVDVFINNALVSRQSVPPGPFSIGNLPVVTGAGQVQLVVRDLFGREQLVHQSFYASQALLRQGLSSFSVEIGWVRENFGVRSVDYGAWLATGTWRRGVTERLTGEAHAEALAGQTTWGLGADYLVPQLGTLSSYLARSQSQADSGSMAQIGIDRMTPTWSFGARTQRTSSGFAQLGLSEPTALPAQVSSANLSYVMGHQGTLGLAYVSQISHQADDAKIASVSYSVGVGQAATLSVAVLANLSGEKNLQLYAMLSIPLSASLSLGGSVQASRGGSGNGRADYSATVQRNLPSGDGYGYRLQARNGAAEASLSLQNRLGTATLDVAQNAGVTATQLSATGGVAVLGSDIFLSRRIDQSFAVARVPGYSGVRVLADNQAAGHTDASGNALIPRLRAYDSNVISIDQRDLPMDAEIGALSVRAVPYFRSGVDVRFPIRRTQGATLTILLEDGHPLPQSAVVRVIGRATDALVGSDGEVYVVNLEPVNRLRADWHGQHCEFEVAFAPGADTLPDLGRFTCKGMVR
jgi:outer membrane usher protein